MDKDKLYAKYKEQVLPGEKSLDQIIDFLKNKVDIEQINFNILPENIRSGSIYNVIHSLRNERIKEKTENLDFLVYKMIKNDRSSIYYSSYIHTSPNQDYDIIYLIIEKSTMCLQSNCNRLITELLIYQGVSEYDYTNKTLMLYSYFSILENPRPCLSL
ncbi:hypothetical protein [Sinanaerobacter sp. ZZT-01]|uniref:hypothetical protein n=1 Tax=Sinanaerobacter sp. ZZT-01 TaxID=3111540 RepID=UPI002D77CCEF|nr:hypothetical protein [Sinanaerobacter sp. ZZT-01]WRR92517.1 hypothetical protein U5921_10690 [Sinanaerobacter sp. ZZT-01]